jgi:hypothetical protein
MYPGRESTMFYTCVGKMPAALTQSKSKVNVCFNILVLVTLLIHISLSVRFWIQRRKEEKALDSHQKNFSVRAFLVEKMKKESFFRYPH